MPSYGYADSAPPALGPADLALVGDELTPRTVPQPELAAEWKGGTGTPATGGTQGSGRAWLGFVASGLSWMTRNPKEATTRALVDTQTAVGESITDTGRRVVGAAARRVDRALDDALSFETPGGVKLRTLPLLVVGGALILLLALKK